MYYPSFCCWWLTFFSWLPVNNFCCWWCSSNHPQREKSFIPITAFYLSTNKPNQKFKPISSCDSYQLKLIAISPPVAKYFPVSAVAGSASNNFCLLADTSSGVLVNNTIKYCNITHTSGNNNEEKSEPMIPRRPSNCREWWYGSCRWWPGFPKIISWWHIVLTLIIKK